MFEFISQKMQEALSFLGRSKEITTQQVEEALRLVRMALLEADVNFGVVKLFSRRLQERWEQARGEQGSLLRLKGAGGKEQVIKWVHDELVSLLGGQPQPPLPPRELAHAGSSSAERSMLFKENLAFDPACLHLQLPFTSILLCGLQGCGKTTQTVKLARFIQKKLPQKRILLAACDRQRPQAIEQLQLLAKEIGVEVEAEGSSALEVARRARQRAKTGFDVLITDTAGRLYVDEALMEELLAIREEVQPHETLFVAGATMGQDVAKAAEAFHQKLELTGSIVTMLDGDAKGGAVLSIHMMTSKPIKFEGIGERVDDLQLFHPHSMADRLLGMGDAVNLIRRLQEERGDETPAKMEEKLKKANFTYEDLLEQVRSVKRMGSLSSLLKMLPSQMLANHSSLPRDDKEMERLEAMISSMTRSERVQLAPLTVSARRRIAKGSGVKIEAVNRMARSLEEMRKMMKNLPKMKQKMKTFFKGETPWR